MPYSEKHNCLFFHITKCAGTSVEVLMEMRNKGLFFGRTRQHYTYTLLKKYGSIDDEFLKNCICLTILRDPLDRIISEYHWMHVKMSFKDFVIEHYIPHYKKMEKDPFKYTGKPHFRPQHMYECKYIADYLIFERLADDWKKFVNKYNLTVSEELPHFKMKNRKNNRNINAYYDSELLSIVNRDLKKDIEFYKGKL
jgi:hypothetical protein